MDFSLSPAAQGVVRELIAQSRIEIDQLRLYLYKTAWLIDRAGARAAQSEIAGIKVAAPAVATGVIDRAIEVFGGAGVSDDTPLAYFYAWAPCCASSTAPTRCTGARSPARNCAANVRSQSEKRPPFRCTVGRNG